MNTNYGEIAVHAAQLIRESENGRCPSKDAWETIAGGDRESDEAAKCAFMRLCSDGCVQGIPQRIYQSTHDERSDYGRNVIEALRYLRCSPAFAADKQRLCNAVDDIDSADSGELDVLIALWNNGDIAPQNP